MNSLVGDDNFWGSVILGRMTTREGYHRVRGAWRPSPAERRVLDELALGRTNAEIGVRLGLSPETVKSHVARLLGETGCTDRAALARWWQNRPQRPPLLLQLFGLAGRTAAVSAALALGALLLVAAGQAGPRAVTDLTAHMRRLTTVHPPDPPPPSPTPATGFVRRPVDVVWVTAPPPLPLTRPVDLALDGRGVLYVVEARQHIVFMFDAATGGFLGLLGGYGHSDGRFDFGPAPELQGGIAVDGADHVYVYDATGRIQKFDPSGAFVFGWNIPDYNTAQAAPFATDVAVGPQGHIYAADTRQGVVRTFDGAGALLATWNIRATALAFDQAGTLYVTDGGTHRVRAYDAQGQLLREWGRQGFRDGVFEGPEGMAVDAQGMVYVVDNLNSRVVKFDGNGGFITGGGAICQCAQGQAGGVIRSRRHDARFAPENGDALSP